VSAHNYNLYLGVSSTSFLQPFPDGCSGYLQHGWLVAGGILVDWKMSSYCMCFSDGWFLYQPYVSPQLQLVSSVWRNISKAMSKSWICTHSWTDRVSSMLARLQVNTNRQVLTSSTQESIFKLSCFPPSLLHCRRVLIIDTSIMVRFQELLHIPD
jgi:hypothetical protein